MPDMCWTFHVCFLNSENILENYDTTKWRQKPKLFRIKPNRYRNDARDALSILCVFTKKWKKLINKSRPSEKKHNSRTTPHPARVDPQTQNPLYSAPVDPQTPNSSYSALGEREHKTRTRVKISVSQKNKPSCTTFPKTHSQTWRIHNWIPNDLS